MNYSTETLSVRLDENRTSQQVVESKIRALGFTPKALSGASTGASPLLLRQIEVLMSQGKTPAVA